MRSQQRLHHQHCSGCSWYTLARHLPWPGAAALVSGPCLHPSQRGRVQVRPRTASNLDPQAPRSHLQASLQKQFEWMQCL